MKTTRLEFPILQYSGGRKGDVETIIPPSPLHLSSFTHSFPSEYERAEIALTRVKPLANDP